MQWDSPAVQLLAGGAFQILSALAAVGFKHYLDSRAPSGTSPLLGSLLMVLVGVVIGGVTAGMRDQFAAIGFNHQTLVGEGLICATCILLAATYYGSPRKLFLYVVQTMLIWASFALTWMAIRGFSENLAGVMVPLITGCIFVGWVWLSYPNARRD